MEGFWKEIGEAWLNVPPSDAGQGTEWEFGSQSPIPAWLPAWLIPLLVLGLITFVVYICWRDARKATLLQRITLIGLRLSVLGVVLFFLSCLTLSVSRTGLPIVVLLIDTSASMNLKDQYRDPVEARQIEELVAEGKAGDATRLSLAKALLTRDNGSLLRRLQERYRLQVYQFSDTASPLGRGEYLREDELPELLDLIQQLRPTGEQTRPAAAVKKVMQDLAGTPPSSILIFSDGITSTNDDDQLSALVRPESVPPPPLFPVGIGSREAALDLHLYGLNVNDDVFVGDRVTFAAKLRAQGFSRRSVTIRLREKDSPAVLATSQVMTGSEGESLDVELTYIPEKEGAFQYVLEAVSVPNEFNVDNNMQTERVTVRKGPLLVLLADSAPRYEFRYLKHLLEREKSVELHSLLLEGDSGYSADDVSARHLRGRFPTDLAQLSKYDVIILGDIDPAELSTALGENLLEHVRSNGGGVILFAGPLFNPTRYRGTPLEPLFPIELANIRVPSLNSGPYAPFRPEQTNEGRIHTRIFRLADREDQSQEIWSSLPELNWMVEADELKPGAVVFAEHPSRSGSRQRYPMIVQQRFGAGLVLFHATDDLWRWRFRVGDLYYGRYWLQAIRSIRKPAATSKSQGAVLTASHKTISQGESVDVILRFLDRKLIPTESSGATVVVERKGSPPENRTLARSAESPTVFTTQLARLTEGSYHIWLASPSVSGTPPSVELTVESPRRELERRTLDVAELDRAARLTSGLFLPLPEATRILDELPEGEPVRLNAFDPIPLWNRWELLTLFASLLTAEWLLRKRLKLV